MVTPRLGVALVGVCEVGCELASRGVSAQVSDVFEMAHEIWRPRVGVASRLRNYEKPEGDEREHEIGRNGCLD